MSHKKKGQQSSMTLRQQAYQRLSDMLKSGEGQSRHIDKQTGVDKERIYSFKSFKTHRQTIEYFIRWLEINHPEVSTMKKARKYTYEWLTSLEGKYSAYTIQIRAKGIGKYYGITPNDNDYYTPPVRHREDITRSRLSTKTDAHFSETKNEELIHFGEHTGLRRSGLECITKESLYSAEHIKSEVERIRRLSKAERTEKDEVLLDCWHNAEAFEDRFNYFILVNEKGGKWRFAPIIGSDEDIKRVVDKIESTASGHRIWGKVSKNYDNHHSRAVYASNIYKMFARPISEIPFDKINRGSGKRYQSDLYICRMDQKGKRMDKRGMRAAEIALGHQKIHTFGSFYSYLL